MSKWTDNPATNFLGDPAGYLSGTNTEGVGGVKKMLFGDPDAIKSAYDEAMNRSKQMGNESKDFLLGQQQKALAHFAPLQNMFQGAYGTQGIEGPQVPQAVGPLAQMYGGK